MLFVHRNIGWEEGIGWCTLGSRVCIHGRLGVVKVLARVLLLHLALWIEAFQQVWRLRK